MACSFLGPMPLITRLYRINHPDKVILQTVRLTTMVPCPFRTNRLPRVLPFLSP